MKQTGSGVGGGWRDGWGLGSWARAHTDGPGQREDWLMINLPWPQRRRSKHGPGWRATSNSGREQEEHGQIWRHSACSLDPVHIGSSSRWSDEKSEGWERRRRESRLTRASSGRARGCLEHTWQKDEARGSRHDNASHWGFFLYRYSKLLLSHSNSPLAEVVGTNTKLWRRIREDNQIIKKMPLLRALLLFIIIFKRLFLPFSLRVDILT